MLFNHIDVVHTCTDDFTIFGYPNELKQAIINIINNAKDAITRLQSSHQGRIEIVTKSDRGTYKIVISDNGGGIPEEIIEKIYDPYFTTKFSGQGTGIGLYMTKAIIEQSMNGTLSFHNTEEGACFEITFKKETAL